MICLGVEILGIGIDKFIKRIAEWTWHSLSDLASCIFAGDESCNPDKIFHGRFLPFRSRILTEYPGDVLFRIIDEISHPVIFLIGKGGTQSFPHLRIDDPGA